jgi:molybdenum cofactor cytidylyltransferase
MLAHSYNLSAILLAAGQSSRFEEGSKLTHLINEKPLISWSLSPLINSNLEKIIIVTGGHAETINKQLTPIRNKNTNITVIHNENYKLGMGASIAAGIPAIPQSSEGVFICLADMPKITKEIITKLTNAFADAQKPETTKNKSIYRPTYQGTPGHPVLFTKTHFEKLSALNGDQGAKEIIKKNKDQLKPIEVTSPHILFDIDKIGDISKLDNH